jgi:hypothetical protein
MHAGSCARWAPSTSSATPACRTGWLASARWPGRHCGRARKPELRPSDRARRHRPRHDRRLDETRPPGAGPDLHDAHQGRPLSARSGDRYRSVTGPARACRPRRTLGAFKTLEQIPFWRQAGNCWAGMIYRPLLGGHGLPRPTARGPGRSDTWRTIGRSVVRPNLVVPEGGRLHGQP